MFISQYRNMQAKFKKIIQMSNCLLTYQKYTYIYTYMHKDIVSK